MSQSIPNCAQNPRKIKQKFIAQHRRAVPSNRAGVLTVQPIRRFPTLEKASVYVSHRSVSPFSKRSLMRGLFVM